MTLAYDEAVAQVTAAGQAYETEDIEISGVTVKVFKNAPGTLRDLLSVARTRPDQEYLVYEDERWTFAEVMARVDEIAAMLVHDYGVGKGDRVTIAMRNYPEWVMSFAAITSIGAISVSANAWWTAEELEYGLTDSGSKVLIADRERIDRAAEALVTHGIDAIAVRAEGSLPERAQHLEDVLTPGAAMPDVGIDPDDDATILYTSGTTGFPKGAVSSNRAVVQALFGFFCRATAEQLRKADGVATDDGPADKPCFILCVPLFHVTGCIPIMLSTFTTGAKLVMMYKWNPERALELIERVRVTNFVGVPTMSWDLLESPDFASRDTSSLLSVGGGGAPAPPELVKRVESGFSRGRPSIGYGMTETNAYGPQNSGDDYVSHPTSTGRSTPILQVEVFDVATGEGPLPRGVQGEICFKGPTLIRGYWNKPEATAETIVDGWLRSGDLGRIDADGFVYVEDRAKDMILRAGENVYCAEVEAAIYQHPAVYEASVFGVPHERLGEEVAVAVYVRPGAELTANELQRFLAEHIAPFKVPSIVTFHDDQLPRNASGKILKKDLRAEHTETSPDT